MAASSLIIRPVRPDEHAQLGDLTVRVYADILGHHLGDYAEVLRDVAARAGACEVLVAVDGDGSGDDGDGRARPLGGITYVPGPGPWAEVATRHEAELRMLVVDPAAQGRGVGAALVRACVERAAAAGKAGVCLVTTPSMVTAHRLYDRLGFVRQPERDRRLDDGLLLECYSLALPVSS
ncbi:MAG: GNAT family N-acetyltransferase [Actinobacteria bacterium]|nr:GNAT family N-acetyltransferase [Actinomycetota bacterium]